MIGSEPLIIKLLEGRQEIGIVLAETKKAAKVLRLQVAGVDIIRSKRGPLLLELTTY